MFKHSGSARWVLTLALFLLGLGTSQEGLEAQFSAQPVILPIPVEGSTEVRELSVVNESDEAQDFVFEVTDFDQDERGAHDYFELGTHDRSCSSRLSLAPEAATLAPGERFDVTVEMAPGEGACWSMVFVRTRSSSDGYQVNQMIGSKVYGFPARAGVEAEISSLVLRGETEAPVAAFEVRNESEAPLHPEGTLEVHSMGGELVEQVEVSRRSLLPGRVLEISRPVPLPEEPGTYLLMPVLDVGGGHLIGHQEMLEVAPDGSASLREPGEGEGG